MLYDVNKVFEQIVNYAILLAELSGVTILVITIILSFLAWIQKKTSVRLKLAEGIALALEFKLGGEVLRTVIAREWSELMILGAIILLRGALTFLIHWEIRQEVGKQA